MTNRSLFLVTACLALVYDRAAPAQDSPAGLWSTISDRDGKPTGVVEIRELNGELVGVVREILVDAGPEDSVCDKCTDDRKGQPIIGMEILRHMRQNGDEWSGGKILDPKNGKVYGCKMHLIEGGKKLEVRGFVGFSLLGRSQVWERQ